MRGMISFREIFVATLEEQFRYGKRGLKHGLGDVKEGFESSSPAELPTTQAPMEVNTRACCNFLGSTSLSMGRGISFSRDRPILALGTLYHLLDNTTMSGSSRTCTNRTDDTQNPPG